MSILGVALLLLPVPVPAQTGEGTVAFGAGDSTVAGVEVLYVSGPNWGEAILGHIHMCVRGQEGYWDLTENGEWKWFGPGQVMTPPWLDDWASPPSMDRLRREWVDTFLLTRSNEHRLEWVLLRAVQPGEEVKKRVLIDLTWKVRGIDKPYSIGVDGAWAAHDQPYQQTEEGTLSPPGDAPAVPGMGMGSGHMMGGGGAAP